MMCVELQFDGNPARLAARPQHRQRLEQLHSQGELVLAGPWADDSGALLVFSTDESRVRQILQDDPYYTTPGVTVLPVREWAPVVGRQ
jgi:uncharacterized protein YciI